MTGKIKGSFIKIQNISFGILETSCDIISNPPKANNFIKSFAFIFGSYPIVLFAYNDAHHPVYYGKPEIVKLLVNVHPDQISWKIYHYRK